MKFWNWFIGKKTVIGLLLLEITRQFQAIHPDWPYYGILITIFSLMSGGGLLHKLARTKLARKFIFKKK